jgi:ADP-ribose pyrophosphatase YjhB (NUDIX family)
VSALTGFNGAHSSGNGAHSFDSADSSDSADPRDRTMPTIRVSAICIVDERLLLVKQGRGNDEYWLLPGGGVRFGESLAEALRREIREELDRPVNVIRPLALLESISPDLEQYRKHVLHVVFAAELGGEPVSRSSGELSSGDDAIRAVAVVSALELCQLDLRPPICGFLQDCLREQPAEMTYLGVQW